MLPAKILSLLVLSAGMAFSASAQSIGPADIDAAGGSTTAGGITHEYAIGQVVAASTFSSSSLIVTPGVLQPVLNSSSGVPQVLTATEISLFPNPASTTLYIQPALNGAGTLTYTLYDVAGRLVLQREAALKTGAEQQRIEMAAFAAGQYSLQLVWTSLGKSATIAFKIQKLQ